MARHLLVLPVMLLLASCASGRIAGKEIVVEETITKQLNPAGTVLAILTRQGDVYRLYLEGRKPKLPPWEMVRTTQHNSAPRLAWWPSGSAALENACGGTFEMPHAQEHYPVPDAEHGPGVGISNRECFP
jgi:hypothetical protein